MKCALTPIVATCYDLLTAKTIKRYMEMEFQRTYAIVQYGPSNSNTHFNIVALQQYDERLDLE